MLYAVFVRELGEERAALKFKRRSNMEYDHSRDRTTLIDSVGHKTYVVTCDLANRMKELEQVGIMLLPEREHVAFFEKFHVELMATLKGLLPEDIEIQSVDMDILAQKVLGAALARESRLRDAIVVSTCFEMSAARRGITLEINRIVDGSGKLIGLGPRPGHTDLTSQFMAISRLAAEGRPVVLVEDGTFSGKTLKYVLAHFARVGVNVDSLIVGLCFEEALTTLEGILPPNVQIMAQTTRPYEWMPDHDFFPFAPNCGLVFGISLGGQALPYYTHDGATFSFPYLSPFGNTEDWASIPKDKVRELSLLCLRTSQHFFGLLEGVNNRSIHCKDLIGTRPRISIPISFGQSQLPNLSSRVVDFLHDAIEEIW